MKLKWTGLSFILAIVMGLVIIGTFIFGQVYFLSPISERANYVAQQVKEQESVKVAYPPKKSLLEDYRQKYEKTWEFLPEGERFNQELIVLEKLASQEKVIVQKITRVGEPESIEGLDKRYKKSTYEVEITSETSKNIQILIEKLEALDRIWNIDSFGFEKLDEASFSGKFIFELFYYAPDSFGLSNK